MHPSWYDVDVEVAARTINLCDECYVPDPLAGKRREAVWEGDFIDIDLLID